MGVVEMAFDVFIRVSFLEVSVLKGFKQVVFHRETSEDRVGKSDAVFRVDIAESRCVLVRVH